MPMVRTTAACFVALTLTTALADAMAIPTGRCDAAKASALVGRPAPSDAEAREATGAVVVRRVRPGQPVTMEFSADRLTLEIVDGKVTAARCG